MAVGYEVTHRIRYGDAVTPSMCDAECARLWINAHTSRQAVYLTDPIRPVGSCTHCGWCGTLVSVPGHGECRLHGATIECPRFDWTAATFTSMVVAQLARKHGPLAPRAWAYLEQIAEDLRDAGRWPNPQRLYRAMTDREIDWA
jgi:hypothetical protein